MDILEVDEAINEKLREMIQTEYISEADNQPPVICSDDREKEEESLLFSIKEIVLQDMMHLF